jgi:hypothetical protein
VPQCTGATRPLDVRPPPPVARGAEDCLHQNYPRLLPAWHAFQSTRAKRRAIEWLVEHSLIDAQATGAAVAGYPDPDLP